jgi:hypothetical protein
MNHARDSSNMFAFFVKFAQLQRAFMAILLLSLVGCFPIRENYFEPSTEGIAAHREMCHGEIGPLNVITMQIGDGSVTVSATRSLDHPSTVNVSLTFTRAGEWQMVSSFKRQYKYKTDESVFTIRTTDFAARSTTSAATFKVTPHSLREVKHGNGTESPLQAQQELKASKFKDNWFILYFDVDLNDEHEFSLVIPQFMIDGKIGASRTIHFIEKSGIWIEPLNC